MYKKHIRAMYSDIDRTTREIMIKNKLILNDNTKERIKRVKNGTLKKST